MCILIYIIIIGVYNYYYTELYTCMYIPAHTGDWISGTVCPFFAKYLVTHMKEPKVYIYEVSTAVFID